MGKKTDESTYISIALSKGVWTWLSRGIRAQTRCESADVLAQVLPLLAEDLRGQSQQEKKLSAMTNYLFKWLISEARGPHGLHRADGGQRGSTQFGLGLRRAVPQEAAAGDSTSLDFQ